MRSKYIALFIGLALVSCQKQPWSIFDGRTEEGEGVGPFSMEYPASNVEAYGTSPGMGDTCFPKSMAIGTKGDDGVFLVAVSVHSSEEYFIE